MMLESVHARLFGEELEPTVVGAHQIVKRLGTGGMGEVYLALNTEFERLEALKVVRSGRAREPRDRQRLVDEGKALAQLAHPNVVHVYGGKIADGNNFYLAMEYAPGQTVEAWQRGEPRPWREVLGVYVAAGEGLRAVHQAGLIHRDFKPSNIILGAEKDGPPRVRIIDFGLATPDDRAAAAAAEDIYGTPFFLSPEQCRGEPVTARSDQYSYCTALYDALYQQHPYCPLERPQTASRVPTDKGDAQSPTNPPTLKAFMEALGAGQTPLRQPPADTRVPRKLFKILARGLMRDPAARYPSMAELLADLSRQLRPSPVLPIAGITIGITGLLIGTLAATSSTLPASCENIGSALSDVWNPARSAAILASFTATDRPYAASTHATIAAAVDARAQQWRRVLGAACNDTYVTGALDEASYARQKRCLDRWRDDLDIKLRGFADASATTVDLAHATISALAPPSDCAQLAADVCATDILDRPEAEELRATFTRTQELEGQGRYAEAATVAADAVSQAQTLGSQPLIAEAAFHRGRLLAELAEWSDARESLTLAIQGAEAGGCRTLAVDAMNELARVDGFDISTAESTVDFSPVILGALDGLPDSELRLARAHKNRGISAWRKPGVSAGEARRTAILRAAEQDLARASDILAAIRPEPPLAELSAVQRYRGMVKLELGETKAALPLVQQALALAQEAYGADHPATWRAEHELGYGLRVNDGDDAVEHLERALRLVDRAYDDDAIHVAWTHVELAAAFEPRYDFPSMLSHAQQAERMLAQRGLVPENRFRFAARRVLGTAHEMNGSPEEALPLRQALVNDAARLAADPVGEVALSYFQLGETQLSLAQWEPALRSLDAGLLLKDDPVALGLRARAQFGLRDAGAVPALRRAEATARRITDDSPNDMIDRDTWIHLAWDLAQATCSEVAPDLRTALLSLPETPRLTRLRQTIDLYDPRQCAPLSAD